MSWAKYEEIIDTYGLSTDERHLAHEFFDECALAHLVRYVASHCMAASIPGDITYEQALVNHLVPLITKRLEEVGQESERHQATIERMRRTINAKQIIMDRWAASARFVKDLFRGETNDN